jgi:hypothetical protein
MSAPWVTYLTAIACLVSGLVHALYSMRVAGSLPPAVKVMASMMASGLFISAIQIAVVVFAPPHGQPAMISVDDFRIALYLAMFSLAWLWWTAMRENLKVARRKPKPKRATAMAEREAEAEGQSRCNVDVDASSAGIGGKGSPKPRA